MPQPVIFLAFANDRLDDAAYLRNLPKELDGVRQALMPAVKAGLCELVERPNATIQQIIDAFQDERYYGRIAIFHYGGHANGYQLLLEALDGSHAAAHSEGLVSFLAKQPGLQTVFLNGCSSQQQALELLQQGIPSVIGTSQSINDDIATSLSVRFYAGLARGFSLEKAWGDAVDEVKIQKGTANMRDLFWEGAEDINVALDQFPWEMYFQEGAEVVRRWSLPDAAANPLFGLPEPNRMDLPEQPYRFLERYTAKHAPIFFGRSYYIRELFQRTTDPTAAPIILFYGQSGVGKSSMLDAGLFPRLEQLCEVVYVRRDADKGLLGSLREALGGEASSFAQDSSQKNEKHLQLEQLKALLSVLQGEAADKIKEAIRALSAEIEEEVSGSSEPLGEALSLKGLWEKRERESGKPLIVLLDQVEEAFTKPNEQLDNELELSLAALYDVFGDANHRPEGKLILSYRKEYHPEIEEGVKKLRLPRENVFLRKLERRDIVEIVSGLRQTERLQRAYRLQIEEGLPELIADDLLEDRESAVAPVLQILLTKMWRAVYNSDSERLFTIADYQNLKRQGILMDDFFREQTELLKERFPELEASGLLLDILYYHTTKLGTANVHSLEGLRSRYAHHSIAIDRLLQACKDLYLLTDAGPQQTGLAHDTLAPIIQREFRQSDKPGQRAALILENKTSYFEENRDHLLDEDDLKIVEAGEGGMRVWLKKEEELIERSRKKREKNRRLRRRVRNVGVIALLLIVGISIFATFTTYNLYQKGRADLYAQAGQMMQWSKGYNEALSYFKMAEDLYPQAKSYRRQSFQVFNEHEVLFPLAERAGGYSTKAVFDDRSMTLFSHEEKGKVLYQQLVQNRENAVLNSWEMKGEISFLSKFKADTVLVGVGDEGQVNVISPLRQQPIAYFIPPKPSRVLHLSQANSKGSFVSLHADQAVYTWKEGEGEPASVFELPIELNEYSRIAISPSLQYLAVAYDSTAAIWDLWSKSLVQQIKRMNSINSVDFSPIANEFLLGEGRSVSRWEVGGEKPLMSYYSLGSSDVRYLPSGKEFLVSSFTLDLFDVESGSRLAFWSQKGQIFTGYTNDHFLIYGGYGRYYLGMREGVYFQENVFEKRSINTRIGLLEDHNSFLVYMPSTGLSVYQDGQRQREVALPDSLKGKLLKSMHRSPDGKWIALSYAPMGNGDSKRNTVVVIDGGSAEVVGGHKLHSVVGVNAKGHILCLAGEEESWEWVGIHPVTGRRQWTATFRGSSSYGLTAEVSRDGQYLRYTEGDSLFIQDALDGRLLMALNTTEGFMKEAIVLSFYSLDKMAVVRRNGEVSLVNLRDGLVTSILGTTDDGLMEASFINNIRWSGNGRYLSLSSNSVLKEWDAETGEEYLYGLPAGDILAYEGGVYIMDNGDIYYNSLLEGMCKQLRHDFTYAQLMENVDIDLELEGGTSLFLWYMASLFEGKEINLMGGSPPLWLDYLAEIVDPTEPEALFVIIGIFIGAILALWLLFRLLAWLLKKWKGNRRP